MTFKSTPERQSTSCCQNVYHDAKSTSWCNYVKKVHHAINTYVVTSKYIMTSQGKKSLSCSQIIWKVSMTLKPRYSMYKHINILSKPRHSMYKHMSYINIETGIHSDNVTCTYPHEYNHIRTLARAHGNEHTNTHTHTQQQTDRQTDRHTSTQTLLLQLRNSIST